jgi:hypothetical protein
MSNAATGNRTSSNKSNPTNQTRPNNNHSRPNTLDRRSGGGNGGPAGNGGPGNNGRGGAGNGPTQFAAGGGRNNNPVLGGGASSGLTYDLGGPITGGSADGFGGGGGGYDPGPGGYTSAAQPASGSGSLYDPSGFSSANNNPIPGGGRTEPYVAGNSRNGNPSAPQTGDVSRSLGNSDLGLPDGNGGTPNRPDPRADEPDDPVAPVAQRLYNRRFLLLQNRTGQPIKIYLRYRTVNSRGQWGWVAGNSGDLIYTLSPGEERYVGHKGSRVLADRVVLWARGDSGELYESYRSRELFLGRPNERDRSGNLAYRGSGFGTFTYRFR